MNAKLNILWDGIRFYCSPSFKQILRILCDERIQNKADEKLSRNSYLGGA